MKIIERIMTNNPCFKAGKKITVKGIMLHSIGCPQPDANVLIKSWDDPSHNQSCVHGFIDANDGLVYQTLPWDYRAWHCGGTANHTHIGIEMCEPACIKYTGGSNFTCSNRDAATIAVIKTYNSAVALFAELCKMFELDPLADGVIISHREGAARKVASNHGDPDHLWKQLDTGFSMDTFRKDVKEHMENEHVLTNEPIEQEEDVKEEHKITGLRAIDLLGFSKEDIVKEVAPLFIEDHKRSGILASVSMAQFLLESAYASGELAQKANNCFGMKKNLSGNKWANSKWDGESTYTKETKEQNADGSYKTISAEFRKYESIEDSIADHSAYLLGAMNGQEKRFKGIQGETDYRKAFQIIKDGAYATSHDYVKNLCGVVEKWNLTQFDAKAEVADSVEKEEVKPSVKDEPANQDTHKEFSVKVDIPNLRIRKGPGTNYNADGHIPIGVYTIVNQKSGEGSKTGWGELKSGRGWISLDYVKRL